MHQDNFILKFIDFYFKLCNNKSIKIELGMYLLFRKTLNL